ncbi:13437_t:CDS:10 [Cetraspora pellucida]|uniref:13437_t:CDS:1 n=1 Tax=Cetraspora pellucida TaxID=1433469 RepID=A0A9N8YT74_9GLOM|nr:13437_t:CDS:10 [Cetraspora pellucida]
MDKILRFNSQRRIDYYGLAGDIDFSKIKGDTKLTSLSTTAKYIKNVNEFCEVFGIKFKCGFNLDSLDLSGLNFNLSGSSITSASIMIAICAEVEVEDNETACRNNLNLTSDLLNFAKQCKNPIDFTKMYGNGFISRVYKGGIFRGLVVFRNTSINQTSDIKSKIGLMNQFLSGMSEAELESSIKDLFSTTEWDVHLSVIGGDLEFDLNRLDLITLLKKAMEFKREVLKNPVKTYVDVIPYEEMPEFMGLDNKVLKYDIDLITNAMKAINLICEYSQLSNDIEEANYYIESRVYPQFKEFEKNVENEKKELIKFIQGAKFDPNIKFPDHDVRMMRSRLKELIEQINLSIHQLNYFTTKYLLIRVMTAGIGMSKEYVGADKMPGVSILLDIMVVEVYITEDGKLDLWSDSKLGILLDSDIILAVANISLQEM